MWKDFLYYTKTERQGIIVLVVLILGVLLLPNLFPLFNRPKEVDTLKQENFRKNIMSSSLLSKKWNPQKSRRIRLPDHP